MLASLLSPATSSLIQGAGVTIFLAFISLIIGTIGGTLAGIGACATSPYPLLRRSIMAYIFIVQGTPLFVQILLVYFALPQLWNGSLSPMTAGIIALGANSTAYVAQIIRAGINAIPLGQWEAAYVLGYSRMETLLYIIFPQVVRMVLPSLLNEVISLVKETSILGFIGVMELTKVARDAVGRTMEPFFWYLAAALLYLCMTSMLALLAKYIEKRVDYDAR